MRVIGPRPSRTSKGDQVVAFVVTPEEAAAIEAALTAGGIVWREHPDAPLFELWEAFYNVTAMPNAG